MADKNTNVNDNISELLAYSEKENMFRIGVITEPHGIKGEVKMYPTTDEPMRIGKLKVIYMDTGKELVPLHPVSARPQNNLMILKVKEYTDRNDVEKLRKKELYVTRDNAVELDEGEYYISDLIGLKCIEEDGNVAGILNEVYQTGANDVYEIKQEDGTTFLIPAIKQCVLEVNVEEGYMKVHIMEGLR